MEFEWVFINPLRLLLIGNSRWHWAHREGNEWRIDHDLPNPDRIGSDPLIWAAVGPVPPELEHRHEYRISLSDVPLSGCPPWLGIDRALGAWVAWRRSQLLGLDLSRGLLLVDAGTIFSLTLLDQKGKFQGGQLIPGLQLQLNVMAEATVSLPSVDNLNLTKEIFPSETLDAMKRGVVQALNSTVLEAVRGIGACLWICGGDAEVVSQDLRMKGVDFNFDPDLVVIGFSEVINNFIAGLNH